MWKEGGRKADGGRLIKREPQVDTFAAKGQRPGLLLAKEKLFQNTSEEYLGHSSAKFLIFLFISISPHNWK